MEEKLCEIADILMKKYDPCQMTEGRCLAGNYQCCYNTRSGCCPDLKDGETCTNPNLRCKVGFCETCVGKMSEECYESFKALEDIARLNTPINIQHRIKDFK